MFSKRENSTPDAPATQVSLVPHLKKPVSAYELLSMVCELITQEPRRYNQKRWISLVSPEKESAPACGTICCVAGWVQTLRANPAVVQDQSSTTIAAWGGVFEIEKAAGDALGLTDEQSRRLFDGQALGHLAAGAMPEVGTAEYAALGVLHIRRFQRLFARQLKAKRVGPMRIEKSK